MKKVAYGLLMLVLLETAASCTRVVVVDSRPHTSRGKHTGWVGAGGTKHHPHGMPPGQAKKMGRR